MGARSTKPSDSETTLFILVDEYKLRVNKHILFSASPYFNAMCNGTLNSAFQNEFRLKKVNPNRIARLIDYINGNRKVMDVHNVLHILLDAKRIIFPGVIQDCEEFIDKHFHEMDVAGVLEIALRHNFIYLEQIVRNALLRQLQSQHKSRNLSIIKQLSLKKNELSIVAKNFLEQVSVQYRRKLSTNSNAEEITINAKDQVFRIDKQLLISASPYFAAILNGNLEETNLNEIEVKEVDPKLFPLLLDYTEGKHAVVTVSNVLDLLEIADSFDFPDIVTHCENLIRTHLQCTKDMKYNLLKPKYLELDYFDVLETAVKISNENLLRLLSKRFDQFVMLGSQTVDVYFLNVVKRRRAEFSERAQNFLDKKCEELNKLQKETENHNCLEVIPKPCEQQILIPKDFRTLRNQG